MKKNSTEQQEPSTPSRKAVWCDAEVVDTIRQAAAVRGESVREYMRVLASVADQHKREAIAAIVVGA